MAKLKKPKEVSVDDLMDLIPEDLLTELTKSLAVDKWVKKLKAGSLFKLILFNLLSTERLSLRLMEANFSDPVFQALAPELDDDQIAWTGIRDRLIHVNSEFFQKIYEAVFQHAAHIYGDKGLAGYHIKRYDSTMIATFSHLLEGMKVGNTKLGKTQVKLTTEFTEGFLIKMAFFKDQAHLSEERALKEVIQDSAATPMDVHVFDKGLKSRRTFDEFDEDHLLFVTRLNKSPRFNFIRPHWQDDALQDNDELEFIQDSVVQLYTNGHQILDKHFRLVQYKVKKEDSMLYFLTNVWDLPALEIATIYRSRWDIEVLFRFLKQEMNLTHFVCNDTNAIQVMLYCTMIAAMLILIYKKENKITSYKKAKIQFFKELLYSILLDIMQNPQANTDFKKKLIHFLQRE